MIKGGKAEKKFEEKIKILTSECHKILDIGTSQRFAKELRAYESLFDKCDYTAAGYEPETKFGKYNCDCHADISNMHFCDESFDAIICIEVLEHVANPFNAVENIFKVLKRGGRLLLTTPFMLGYHGKTRDLNVYKTHAHSAYPDFWRFTHEGLSYLLKDFSEVDIDVLDGPIEAGLKIFRFSNVLEKSNLFRKLLDKIDRPKLGCQTSRHLIWAKK